MQKLEWFAYDRLDKFRVQLSQIERSEFMAKSTEHALSKIKSEVDALWNEIPEIVELDDYSYLVQLLVRINQKVFSLTSYLGVLLRSTNLRNSFEAFYAFEEMARYVIKKDNLLIISSEWDASPFFIPSPPEALKDFVIIGIPAFASRNALLLPLAGHEFGHAIYRTRDLDGPLNTTAEFHLKNIIEANIDEFNKDFGMKDDLFGPTDREEVERACLIVVGSHSEELFCDAFGASVFDSSYRHAFEYMLSPGFEGEPTHKYPPINARFSCICSIVGDAPGIPDPFPVAAIGRGDKLMKWVDRVVKAVEPAIISSARNIAGEITYEDRVGSDVEAIKRNFRQRIPANRPCTPVAILNAAWGVYLENLDTLASREDRSDLLRITNNMCLKSLEIYERNSSLARS